MIHLIILGYYKIVINCHLKHCLSKQFPAFLLFCFLAIPNYNGSSCDTINSQAINQPNSLEVSLTSTLGNKCNGGNNLGLIIGLSVAIPCGMVIFLGVSLAAYHYSRNKEFNQKMKNLAMDIKLGKQEWQENKRAKKQGIVWTNNISDDNWFLFYNNNSKHDLINKLTNKFK